jgi:hypothetical protein
LSVQPTPQRVPEQRKGAQDEAAAVVQVPFWQTLSAE